MNMFPERPGDAQAQQVFFASASLPLDLVDAATLLGYLTVQDADGRDIPAATSWRVRGYADYYLGTVLMDLALQGRVGMDKPTPLEDHASYYERRHKWWWKPFWFFVLLFVLPIACLVVFLQTQQGLPFILLPGFTAYVLLILLLFGARSLFSREKRTPGKLGVVNPTPTGNAVLDAILGQMLATGESRKVYNWLYGSGALSAAGLYAITERRLAEHGWITLTGKGPVFGRFKVETMMLNRQSDQWQAFGNQLRSVLLLGDAPSSDMGALLLCLTLLPETLHNNVHLPGQPIHKVVTGLEQIISFPQETMIARQRLQTLMQGDQVIEAAIGGPLYDTLLSIRNGVEQSLDAKYSA